MKELLETLRVQITNTLYQGYKLKPVKLEDEWFGAFEHHIPIFNQAQHVLWVLDQLENPEVKMHKMLALGFVEGWMFSREICTLEWIQQLHKLYAKVYLLADSKDDQ